MDARDGSGSISGLTDPPEGVGAVRLVSKHQAEQGQADQVMEVAVRAIQVPVVEPKAQGHEDDVAGHRQERGLEDLAQS